MAKTVKTFSINFDRSDLYGLGKQLGMDEEKAKLLTTKAQNVKITVIVNPDDATIHVIGINGTPLDPTEI